MSAVWMNNRIYCNLRHYLNAFFLSLAKHLYLRPLASPKFADEWRIRTFIIYSLPNYMHLDKYRTERPKRTLVKYKCADVRVFASHSPYSWKRVAWRPCLIWEDGNFRDIEGRASTNRTPRTQSRAVSSENKPFGIKGSTSVRVDHNNLTL